MDPDEESAPAEPAPKRRRRRPTSLRTSAVDSSAAALGERVTSASGTVNESEPTTSILESAPVIGWMRAAGIAPSDEEAAPEAEVESTPPPPPPRRGRRRSLSATPTPAPEPDATFVYTPSVDAGAAAAPEWVPVPTSLPTPEPAPVPPFVQSIAAGDAAAYEQTPPEPEPYEPAPPYLAPAPDLVPEPAPATDDEPVEPPADPAAGLEPAEPDAEPPLDDEIPLLDPSRIDQSFDKFSEMATGTIKKLADNVTKRSSSTDPATGTEAVPGSTGEGGTTLPAPVGGLAKLFSDRPELGVIATFAGGLFLATLLKRLAR